MMSDLPHVRSVAEKKDGDFGHLWVVQGFYQFEQILMICTTFFLFVVEMRLNNHDLGIDPGEFGQ